MFVKQRFALNVSCWVRAKHLWQPTAQRGLHRCFARTQHDIWRGPFRYRL